MSLLSEALKEYGVEEIVGEAEHNPAILKYFKEIGHSWVHDDETAWCSAFINAMAFRSKLEMSGKLDARSWLKVGVSVPDFVGLDNVIVIYWRGSVSSWKGHVGIPINYDEDGVHINTLGGNQGNMVRISGYNKGRLLDYRQLKDVETT